MKASKSLIGIFVLGAVALSVAAIIVFGSGMFLTKKFPMIMFFEKSVSGLEVGSPVMFRGVPIGAVKEISISTDPTGMVFTIPVIVEIEGKKIRVASQNKDVRGKGLLEVHKGDPVELLNSLIEQGLRAQLVTQSFVTGQLAIALDFFPDKPARLVGSLDYVEVPTTPSDFDALADILKQLPLKEMVERITAAAAGIEKVANSKDTQEVPENLNTALKEASGLLKDARDRIGPLDDKLNAALQTYTDLGRHLDQRTEGVAASLGKALDTLDTALAKIQKVASADSATVVDLNKALNEIAGAARAVRGLAGVLERHPEALIQGKGNRR